jgi:hypothetical protein
LDKNWCNNVDHCYKTVCSFIWLINFDYYALLRKFNRSFEEIKFKAKPHFSKINAADILENIKDFLAIAEYFDQNKDWEAAIGVLGKFRSKIGAGIETWRHHIYQLQNILSSKILLMIVQYSAGDLNWKNRIIIPRGETAVPFLNGIIDEARATVYSILADENISRTKEIISSIFNPGDVVNGAKYYVETRNNVYDGTNTSSFKYTVAFDYSLMFISSQFENIKTICDMFVIYGKWIDTGSMHSLSQKLHEITIVNEKLTAYDKSLSENGERGRKLMHMETNLTKGRHHRHNLCRYIDSINDEVFVMISSLTDSLTWLCLFFKDFQNIPPDNTGKIISNWNSVYEMLNCKKCSIDLIAGKMTLFLKLLGYKGFGTGII